MASWLVLITLLILKTCTGRYVNIEGENFLEHEGQFLFQNDMIVRRPMLEKALKGNDVDKETISNKSSQIGEPKTGKVAFGLYTMKWENAIIPYTIHKDAKCSLFNSLFGWAFKSLSCPEKAIKKAIAEWESKTCIRFTKWTGERDYVEVTSSGFFGECYSNVGRIGGRQVINIDDGCSTVGIILHEIGHALGLHHEQSRPDRDDYVKIHLGNVKDGAKVNFKKYPFSQINSLGTKYDYRSIMHYGKNAFAKFPWQITIEPKKSGVKIGQRRHLSKLDIETTRKYYNCP